MLTIPTGTRILCLLTFTYGGIHPGPFELTPLRHGDVSWMGSTPMSPAPASLHLLALQLTPSLSGSKAPECPLYTLPFGFGPGDEAVM